MIQEHFKKIIFVTIFICCSLFFSGYANATSFHEAPIVHNHCSGLFSQGLKNIMIPLDHSQKTTQRMFSYTYQHLKATQSAPQTKTLVYLSGGPGEGSIGSSSRKLFKTVREAGFDLILIDVRGSACNNLEYREVADHLISTDQAAQDVVEVLKNEDIRNYIIMGHSYGTVLGTVLTSKINALEGFPQPELLILDGVLSRALSSGSEYQENIARVVEHEMPKKFPAVKNLIEGGLERELPFDLPQEYWLRELQSYARVGDKLFRELKPDLVRFLINYPQSLDDQALEQYFTEDYQSYLVFEQHYAQQTLSEDLVSKVQINYVYYSIMCKELSSVDVSLYGLRVSNGDLEVHPKPSRNVCSLFDRGRTFYSSKDHTLKTKTLYFYGTADGQTPVSYFLHHYNHNKSVDKEVVRIEGGGHGAFAFDLKGCAVEVWSKLQSGSTDFSAVLDQEGHCI